LLSIALLVALVDVKVRKTRSKNEEARKKKGKLEIATIVINEIGIIQISK